MELQDIALQLRHRDAPARCDDECRDAHLQASWDLTGRVAGLAHATLAAKVAAVRHVLPAVWAARRQRWRMSCRQLRVGDDMVATARAGVVADVGAIRCCLQKQVELHADLLQLDFGGPARLLCLVAHRRAPSQRRRRQFACASESSLCSHARGVALVACPSGVVSGTPAVTALGQPTWRSSDRLRAADLQLHRAQLRLRWEGVSTKPSLQGQIGHVVQNESDCD